MASEEEGNATNYPEIQPPDQQTDGPTTAQLFNLLQQQQAQILQLIGNHGGGKGKGGFGGGFDESAGTDIKPVMAKVTDAPEFRGNFDVWLKLLKDWEATHYAMDPKQKPGLVLKGLKGDALALARNAVGDKLNDPSSYQVIVDTLKQYYGTAAGLKKYGEFQKLTSTVRERSVRTPGNHYEA